MSLLPSRGLDRLRAGRCASGRTSGVGKRAVELGGDRGRPALLGPDDTDGPGAGERHAGRAGGGSRAQLGEERRVGRRGRARAARSWNDVGEQLGVARGDRGAEQRRRARRRRPRRRGGRTPAAASATARVFTRVVGDDDDRGERQVGRRREPRAGRRRCARSGRRRRAARRRGCRRGPRAAGPSSSSSSAASVAARGRARRRRARRRRVAADEPSPRSSGMRLTKRKRCPSSGATSAKARSARCVASRGSSPAPSPSSATSGSPVVGAADLELVPEVERRGGAVEARRRGWRSSPARGRRTCCAASRPTPRRGSTRRSARRRRSCRAVSVDGRRVLQAVAR